MSADPRYPIGPYAPPVPITHPIRQEWITAIAVLPRQLSDVVRDLSEQELGYSYREGGWTIRQIVHHLADSHINSYCRFRFALTEDKPTIKAYDEAAWARLPDASAAPVDPSLQLLSALHSRWVALLRSLDETALQRTFLHPERGSQTLDGTIGLYAWHGRHHLAHIRAARGLAASV